MLNLINVMSRRLLDHGRASAIRELSRKFHSSFIEAPAMAGPRRGDMRVVSLFSGIGGFESGFERSSLKTVLMCENDPSAIGVLKQRYPEVEIHADITTLMSLPACEILVGGWPCQDLSQAGRMAGIKGSRSGLVDEVFRLIDGAAKKPDFIILENVAFALNLQKGLAIRHVVQALEERGYRWAYRILDTRFFGLPQRRRRIFICASLANDPKSILFDPECQPVGEIEMPEADVGFYWTEGNRGIGWSKDAIPPLKGGSAISIPSPPGVWHVDTGTFSVPGIQDAERLQGFPADWTKVPDATSIDERKRWRLVGNAVSVPVAAWIGNRILHPPSNVDQIAGARSSGSHNAAWGGPRKTPTFIHGLHEGPAKFEVSTLRDFGLQNARPMSHRAAAGFAKRYAKSQLKKNHKLLNDLFAYCGRTRIDNSVSLDNDRESE